MIAVYPGTFDPLTRGHEDLVRRAEGMCSKLILGVADSRAKGTLFTLDERVEMAEEAVQAYSHVSVEPFTGLLKDFAERLGARIVIRGLRAVTDFEAEFQMAQVNRQMAETVETMFLMTSPDYAYISSSVVKQVEF